MTNARGLMASRAFFDVARGGVEPPTFRFSGGRSYRLSYLAAITDDVGDTCGPDGI
jgi:hypothetical protein